ncbi:hypothetical protein J132_01017 [Termitomyces sp. J132]|nr:hypothetical protein J132_01017 [Termitomyces sp. J132]
MHTQKVTASTVWWTTQIACLSHTSGGMHPQWVCQLYNTVTVPAFTYTADMWFTGVTTPSDGGRRLGSVSVIKKLCPTQHKVAKLVTNNKDAALVAITNAHASTSILVYCDGSGFKGGIGALVVLYVNCWETSYLTYHLGSDAEHTVYKGKAVSFTLGLHLLTSVVHSIDGQVIMGSNSQAAIKALLNQCPHPAHYLLNQVHMAAENLHHTRGVINLQVHWSPSHVGYRPNERAYELTKIMAQGTSSTSKHLPVYLRSKPLPASVPATCQHLLTNTIAKWKCRWRRSPHFKNINRIDESFPSQRYMWLVRDLRHK